MNWRYLKQCGSSGRLPTRACVFSHFSLNVVVNMHSGTFICFSHPVFYPSPAGLLAGFIFLNASGTVHMDQLYRQHETKVITVDFCKSPERNLIFIGAV